MNFIKTITLCLLISSCASYVANMHREIDSSSPRRLGPRSNKDHFDMYRDKAQKRSLDYRNNSVKNLKNTTNTRFRPPTVKRQYSNLKRRYKAEDLIDNENDGSLWTSGGQETFLFSKNNYKRNGDIVIVKVLSNLKKEISAELSRAFPDRPKPKQEDDKEKKEGTATGAQEEKVNNSTDNEPSDPNKIYDRISSVVVEEINKDHLLIRGRKDVLHKKSKRTIEIQALVSRRDILDDDTLKSTSILESNVTILR